MNFANMSQLSVGVVSYHNFNETVFCLNSAIRDNQLKKCTNITGMQPSEYFIIFLLQVSDAHFAKKNISCRA
jgi:hypothetical protein